MNSCLKITEEYLTFDEREAENLIESIKANAQEERYELIGYSTTKKSKKTIDYYIVKIVKEFAREKDLVMD